MSKPTKSNPVKSITSITDLVPDQHNPNKHTMRGLGVVEINIEENGWGDSWTVDKHGNVISGNGRQEIAIEKGMLEPLVIQSDGTRPIIHQRIDLDLTSEDDAERIKAQRLALLMNRSAQLSIDLDPVVLARLSEMDVPIDDVYSVDEISALLSQAEKEAAQAILNADQPILPASAQNGQSGFGLKLGKKNIPLTEAEMIALNERLDEHVEEHGTYYGFVTAILGLS